MKNESKPRAGIMLLVGLMASLGSASPAFAQGRGVIRGVVTSSITGEPLAGVTARLGDGSMEARTGEDGRFVLRGVPIGQALLRVELLPGFITTTEAVEVHAGETIQMALTLVPVAAFLDELLVEGRPSDLGGVVRRFSEEDAVASAGSGTVVDLLARGFPGVEVRRGSGQVGTGARILIRGANSLTLPADPLVFLDGIRIDDPSEMASSALSGVVGILETVPASTVERIEILKGPSASRFGIGSASGVILIWTRRGGMPASAPAGPNHLPNPH